MCGGFFSQLKRSIDGTHHHVSTTHLQRYLDQFDFMYSLCKQTDSARMHVLIDRAGGPPAHLQATDQRRCLTRRTAGMATPAARQVVQ